MRVAAILLVTLAALSVQAQKKKVCSEHKVLYSVNRYVFEDYGTVGYPLSGWVGYTNTGAPVQNLTVECFSRDGKTRLSSTRTDSAGRFSFPKLKEGEYLLETTAEEEHVSPIDAFVRVSKGSKAVACLVAEAQ